MYRLQMSFPLEKESYGASEFTMETESKIVLILDVAPSNFLNEKTKHETTFSTCSTQTNEWEQANDIFRKPAAATSTMQDTQRSRKTTFEQQAGELLAARTGPVNSSIAKDEQIEVKSDSAAKRVHMVGFLPTTTSESNEKAEVFSEALKDFRARDHSEKMSLMATLAWGTTQDLLRAIQGVEVVKFSPELRGRIPPRAVISVNIAKLKELGSGPHREYITDLQPMGLFLRTTD